MLVKSCHFRDSRICIVYELSTNNPPGARLDMKNAHLIFVPSPDLRVQLRAGCYANPANAEAKR